jgi:hypothetical protein
VACEAADSSFALSQHGLVDVVTDNIETALARQNCDVPIPDAASVLIGPTCPSGVMTDMR